MALGTESQNPQGAGGGSTTVTALLGLTTAGQQLMANSLPVVIASNQSAVPVNINDGSGTPLISGKSSVLASITGIINGVIYGQNGNTPSVGVGSFAPLQMDDDGNLLINIPTFAQGTFGNSDGNSAGIFSATVFTYNELFNGTTWDRLRSASAGQGTTGQGVAGEAILGWDGTNYQRIGVNDTATSGKFGLDNNILSILGTAPTTAGMVNVGGLVATNVAITDNPINLGVQGVSSENSAVTTGRKVQLVADLVGKLITMPYANKENFLSGVATATGTSAASVISAQGASVKIYVTGAILANTGATTSLITIQNDPTGTPSTLAYTINPAGGGSNITFSPPLVSAANKAVGWTPGSSSTTQYITLIGYAGS